jgi:hypothetical protein
VKKIINTADMTEVSGTRTLALTYSHTDKALACLIEGYGLRLILTTALSSSSPLPILHCIVQTQVAAMEEKLEAAAEAERVYQAAFVARRAREDEAWFAAKELQVWVDWSECRDAAVLRQFPFAVPESLMARSDIQLQVHLDAALKQVRLEETTEDMVTLRLRTLSAHWPSTFNPPLTPPIDPSPISLCARTIGPTMACTISTTFPYLGTPTVSR